MAGAFSSEFTLYSMVLLLVDEKHDDRKIQISCQFHTCLCLGDPSGHKVTPVIILTDLQCSEPLFVSGIRSEQIDYLDNCCCDVFKSDQLTRFKAHERQI